MNKSALEAVKLLQSLGCAEPKDMDMEEIAWACDLAVNRKEMDGSEGRILMNEKTAFISVNSKIDYQPKVNFIIAHEIGHAVLHRKQFPLYNDTNKTLSDWYANGIHETEANAFATELLMPTNLFVKKIKTRKLDLSLIESVADYFGSSKTATFIRYKDLGEFPVMIIFIENGIIKWKTCSVDFPFQWLPLKSKVPAWTVAGDYYNRGVIENSPSKVEAGEWFAEDYKIKGNETQKLWEQCFPVGENSILSCVWTK
jgi:Zn-dependent peptidase ImmA (M78 family)